MAYPNFKCFYCRLQSVVMLCQPAARSLEVASNIGRKILFPLRLRFTPLCCELSQSVAEHLLGKISKPRHGPPLPQSILKLSKSRRAIGSKHTKAQIYRQQIGQWLMVRRFPIHQSATEQNKMSKLMRDCRHQRQRISQLLTFDSNHALLLVYGRMKVQSGSGFVSAPLPDRQQLTQPLVSFGEDIKLDCVSIYLHRSADSLKQPLRRGFTLVIGIGKILGNGQHDFRF